jgi:PAS domain S-box-containing protein
MYVHFIESAYEFFREHFSLAIGEFIANVVFLYLVGLLFVMYRRWRRVYSRQKELENVIESISPDVILVVDQNGNINMCNSSIKRMFGYEVEEVEKQKTDLLYVVDKSDTNHSQELQRSLQQEGFNISTAIGKKKNGDMLHIEVITGKLINQRGAVLLLRDITLQKLIEKEHRFSEEKFRLIAENLDDLIAVLDLEGRRLYNSPSYGTIFDDPDKLINTDSFAEIHPDDREGIKNIFRETIKTGIGQKGEFRFLLKDGSVRFVESQGSAVKDENGKITNVIVVSRDVTDRKEAEEQLLQNFNNLQKTFKGTIQAMAAIVETRDPYTAGHQKRVSNLAQVIAQEMGLPKDTIDNIRMAGTIHDIGKISVPSEILSKPGKISDIEMSLIRVHPQSGYDILKDVELPYPIAEIILQHHERLNGSGYPQGLKGEQILLEARIISVADVVEAISSHRPYRPAKGIDVALEEIEKNKSILYDAQVVEACLKLFREKGFVYESTES